MGSTMCVTDATIPTSCPTISHASVGATARRITSSAKATYAMHHQRATLQHIAQRNEQQQAQRVPDLGRARNEHHHPGRLW